MKAWGSWRSHGGESNSSGKSYYLQLQRAFSCVAVPERSHLTILPFRRLPPFPFISIPSLMKSYSRCCTFGLLGHRPVLVGISRQAKLVTASRLAEAIPTPVLYKRSTGIQARSTISSTIYLALDIRAPSAQFSSLIAS